MKDQGLATASACRYEEEKMLHAYLAFHYGSDHEQLPFEFGPHNALHFPVRCVTECIEVHTLPLNACAIDIGCAVGRSTFELARHYKHVVGIDSSTLFIDAAKQLQSHGEIGYTLFAEGMRQSASKATLPKEIDPSRVEFRCCDAMRLLDEGFQYDLVLAANLLCRLRQPALFLKRLPDLLKEKGQLILISPYSWLEEFTQKDLWLTSSAEDSALESIKTLFGDRMQLQRCFDMPFLIREHYRKYQWGISQASIWSKT